MQEPTTKSQSKLKRLALIIKLIELEDTEAISAQICQLISDDLTNDELEIIQLLNDKKYHEVILKINELISSNGKIELYKDPEIYALQFEIKQLESQILESTHELSDIERVIAEFNFKMQIRLGEKMDLLYNLRTQKTEKEINDGEDGKEIYEDTKKQYDEFKKVSSDFEESGFIDLKDEDKLELKKLYRASALLCHPDRFSNASIQDKNNAEDIFKDLHLAYEKQDLVTIKLIYDKLKGGLLNILIKPQDSIELLKITVKELNLKLTGLISKVMTYKQSEVYQIIIKYPDISIYFDLLENKLTSEIQHLKESGYQYE